MNWTVACAIAYLIASMAIGWRGRTRVPMTEDQFVAAGRSLSAAQVGFTTFAGWVGLAGLFGTIESIQRFGISGVFWFLAWLPGALLMGAFLANRLRRRGHVTVAELVRAHAGPLAGGAAAAVVSWSYLAWAAAQIAALAAILGLATNIAPTLCAVFVTITMLVHICVGGLRGLVRSDSLHALVLLLVVLVVAPALAFFPAGQADFILTSAQARQGFLSLTGAGGGTLLLWFLSLAPAAFIDPGGMQKIFAASTPRAARRGLLLAGGIYLVFGLALGALGLAAHALLPGVPPDRAMPALMAHLLPPGLRGLSLGLVVAVAISTADTALLVVATTLQRDVYARWRPGASPRERLVISRALVMVAAVAAAVMAVMGGSVVTILLLGFAIFVPGLLLPVLAAAFDWHVSARASLGALTLGVTAAASWSLAGEPGVPAVLVGLAASGIPFAIGAIGPTGGRPMRRSGATCLGDVDDVRTPNG